MNLWLDPVLYSTQIAVVHPCMYPLMNKEIEVNDVDTELETIALDVVSPPSHSPPSSPRNFLPSINHSLPLSTNTIIVYST